MARICPSAASAARASRSAMRRVLPPRAASASIVSSAAILPSLMISTRLQVMVTSARMWVERITVCSPAKLLMSCRISRICDGSSPTVGSSRINTSGSCRMAWASPTRCWNPFDRLPISRPATC